LSYDGTRFADQRRRNRETSCTSYSHPAKPSLKNKNEKILVFVKSKRVPVAITYVEERRWTTLGAFKVKRGVLHYNNQLDDAHIAILDYAKQVAAYADISLEVIDLSKRNFLSRFARRLVMKNPQTPSIVFPGTVLAAILGIPSSFPKRKLGGPNALAISRPGQKG